MKKINYLNDSSNSKFLFASNETFKGAETTPTTDELSTLAKEIAAKQNEKFEEVQKLFLEWGTLSTKNISYENWKNGPKEPKSYKSYELAKKLMTKMSENIETVDKKLVPAVIDEIIAILEDTKNTDWGKGGDNNKRRTHGMHFINYTPDKFIAALSDYKVNQSGKFPCPEN